MAQRLAGAMKTGAPEPRPEGSGCPNEEHTPHAQATAPFRSRLRGMARERGGRGRRAPLVRVGSRIGIWATLWLLSAISLAGAADAPLADAAETMDRGAIRSLLKETVDVNAPQVDGMTALHWASRHDDLEMANLLVGAGAQVNAANRYGVTPLTLACTNGNAELVELLLDAGADPNSTLPGGETALMTAARTGRLGPVKALLARGAAIHGKVHGMGRQEGAGANAFLIRMADPTIFDFETKPEQTALLWAAAEGHADVVAELIKAGADFQTALSSGFTPLLFAVRNGHSEVVKTLIEAGVDVNQRIEPVADWRHRGYGARLRPGAISLHVAVENGHFDLATYLLEVGADPDAAGPIGYTALHAITRARRVALGDADPPPEPSGDMSSLDFVGELAAHGANLNARMNRAATINLGDTILGPTAFLAAAQTADLEFMKTLIDLGVDPMLTNEDGKTALMLAGGRTGTPQEVLATMQLALDVGIDIDAVDHNGETAMHSAAYKDRAEPIKLLAAKGARIEIWNRENKYGSTPLAIAVGYRRPRSFRPQPKAEAAIREVMIAAGVTPPEKVTVVAEAQ